MSEPLLADTHVLLWYFEARELHPRRVRQLDTALGDSALCASAVSVFEIGLLTRKGRLRRMADVALWVQRAVAQGLMVLPLDVESAAEAARLPAEPPGDPFDQMLIATSRVHGLTLATRDSSILDYAAAGHARVLEI